MLPEPFTLAEVLWTLGTGRNPSITRSWRSWLGYLASIGWIRGERHSFKGNDILPDAPATTHAHHIAPNHPHEVGLFIAHRW
jgi:hypothetical protein